MKIPLISKSAPAKSKKVKKTLAPPPKVSPFRVGGARRFFIPELLSFVDSNRDGKPDSLKIGVTNIRMAQRLTAVSLSIDGRAVPGAKLKIDNGFAIFRADDVRRIRFAPGADFTITAEGALPSAGAHYFDLILTGSAVDVEAKGIPIIVKDGRVRYSFADDGRKEAGSLADKPRLFLIPYTTYSAGQLKDVDEAPGIGAGNILEAVHLCAKHDAYYCSISGAPALRYLDVHDAQAPAALKSLVAKGRIDPVFTDPEDYRWTSEGGESVIRRLVQWQLYCLDRFGDISKSAWLDGGGGLPGQLPQILKKCGFSGLLLTANLPVQERTSFIWRAPDGGGILVHRPGAGYEQAYPICFDEARALENFAGIIGGVDNKAEGAGACIPTGTVMGTPQERTISFVEQWNARYPHQPLECSTFTKYLESLGEEVEPEHKGHISPKKGDYQFASSPLCLARKKIECSLLELETLWLLAARGGVRGRCDPSKKLWKLLHRTQSSNKDKATLDDRSEIVRLRKVEVCVKEAGRELLDDLAARAGREGESNILIANTLGFPRRDAAAIDLGGVGGRLPVIHDGKSIVPTQILQSELFGDGAVKRARVLALVDAPACGYRIYHTAVDPGNLKEPEDYFFPNAAENVIENGFYKFELDSKNGGVVSAYDRKRDWAFKFRRGGLLWSPIDDKALGALKYPDAKSIFRVESCEVIENGPVRAALKYRGRVRGKRASITYRLIAGSRRLDIEAKMEKSMPGAGLCADFDVKLNNPNLYCDGPFEIRRVRGDYYPVQSFCELASDDRGVAFLNDGAGDWRAVGKGIRATFWNRAAERASASAQAGATFRYAVYLHAGSFEKGGAVKRGAAFARPLVSAGPLPGRASGEAAQAVGSFLRVEPGEIMLSAFYKDEKGRLVFRLWETLGKLSEARIVARGRLHSVAVVDCLGREAKYYTPESGIVRIPFRPHEIKTCRLVYDG